MNFLNITLFMLNVFITNAINGSIHDVEESTCYLFQVFP